jgi:hypothetical protein
VLYYRCHPVPGSEHKHNNCIRYFANESKLTKKNIVRSIRPMPTGILSFDLSLKGSWKIAVELAIGCSEGTIPSGSYGIKNK